MGRRGSVLGLVSRLCFSILVLAGACVTTSPRRSPIDQAVEAAAHRCACRIGVSARHLESGAVYAYSGDSEFEAASVIKIAIVTEVMAERREGKIDLAERWSLT